MQAQRTAEWLRTPVGKLSLPIMQGKAESVIVVYDEVRKYGAHVPY